MPLLSLGALPERLDTERLFLRPYRVGDARWYFTMGQRNLAHLERHESGNTVFGIHCVDDAAGVLRGFTKHWQERTAFALGVFLQGSEEFAGQLYLEVTHAGLPALNLGFFADCTHVNRGYMTEAAQRGLVFAFAELGAHRVGLWCDDTNVPSRRIAERCGFRLEGHVREDKRHADGSITGSLCYGLLRGEFEPESSRQA
ncbi:MAG: GNAT family N-acetyltransferase [Opitutaceae bacterium]|nr:GNAT family N-acetyltransferase [Opitutaceae bacterium]